MIRKKNCLNSKVKIIAGPCSINKENISDIYKLVEIKINNISPLWGVRVVGLKSRTNFKKDKNKIGIDVDDYLNVLINFKEKGKIELKNNLPSINLAKEIYKNTNLLIATEIVDSLIQPLFYEGVIPENKLLLWNPAVNQLGWSIFSMAQFIKKNKWFLGIKNPKWLGDYLKDVDNLNNDKITTAEKTWEGLVSYASLNKRRIILVHRGFDIPEKKDFRNFPAHHLALKVKKRIGCKMFFDPSHSYGPKMKESIVEETVKALKIKISENEYLYDGILIEVGKSKTDAEQHISIEEFKELCFRLNEFRDF